MEETKNYILLVEDNPDVVELTTLAFKKNNFANDIVVEDRQEAIDLLLGDDPGGVPQRGYPELILQYLKLPKIDRHEVLKNIKKDSKTRRIPVVILTSSQEEEDITLKATNRVPTAMCASRLIIKILWKWRTTWISTGWLSIKVL